MKHYTGLALRQVLRQKKLSALCVLGIAIAVALTYVLLLAADGIKNTRIAQAKELAGDYDVQLMGIPDNYTLPAPDDIDTIGYTYGGMLEIGKENSTLTTFAELDTPTLEMLGVNLVQGRFPQSSMEVLISETLLHAMGRETAVDQEIAFSIAGKDDLPARVAGIYQNKVAYAVDTNTAVFLGKDTFAAWGLPEAYEIQKRSLMLRIKEDIPKLDAIMIIQNSLPEGAYFDFNDLLLTAEGYTTLESGSGEEAQTTMVMAVVVILLVVAVFFMIYNAYNISIKNRTEQLGMLRAIGATPAEIRRIVLAEAALLSAIALPIGWLISAIMAGSAFSAIAAMFPSDGMGAGMAEIFTQNIRVSPFALILSAATGLALSFLSVLAPARKASKISALSAINGGESVVDIHGRRKKPLSDRHLYWQMARLNLKRNRKRTRLATISLSMGILFAMGGAVFSIAFPSFAGGNITGDYSITSNAGFIPSPETPGFASEIAEEIANMPGVGWVDRIYYADALDDAGMGIVVAGRESEALREGPKAMVHLPENAEDGSYANLQPGKILRIQGQDIEIIGMLEASPFTASVILPRPYILLDGDQYTAMYQNDTITRMEIYLNAEASEQEIAALEKRLKDIQAETPGSAYVSALEAKEELHQIMQKFLWMVWGFAALIVFIAFLNTANTIYTSIVDRRMEFGMLRAIGITPEELSRMLRREGMVYSLYGMLFGGMLGIAGAYCIPALLKTAFISIWNLLLVLGAAYVVTTGICLLCVALSLKNMMKQNVMNNLVRIG